MKQMHIPVQVKTGDYEVISSGIVHTNGTEITFNIASLKVKFTFNVDDGSARFQGSISDNTLIIALYNFNDSIGEGKLDPVEIGSVGGKNLYVTWFVTTIDDKMRQFNYSFLTKDK